ncbi:hypothetical protein [Solimonas variicoloris]|uniref:hypothetical protein n=1 Tax=Solimonas variicoloris TaxID=254408 RepID=UPI0003A1949B|nr:hypothetical protein [Solimonas variicoloris]
MKTPACKSLALALGAAFAAGAANGFAATDLGRGYELAANTEPAPKTPAAPVAAPASQPADAGKAADKTADKAAEKAADKANGKADKAAEHACGEGMCGSAPPPAR